MIIILTMKPFDAAHQLPYHHGKCANLHGHTYNVKVGVEGPIQQVKDGNSESGMVVDFGFIKDIYNTHIHDRLDHSLILGTDILPWMVSLHLEDGSKLYTHLPLLDKQANLLTQIYGKVAILPIRVTTAELLARWMFGVLAKELSQQAPELRDVYIYFVEVYETATSAARWTVDDEDDYFNSLGDRNE